MWVAVIGWIVIILIVNYLIHQHVLWWNRILWALTCLWIRICMLYVTSSIKTQRIRSWPWLLNMISRIMMCMMKISSNLSINQCNISLIVMPSKHQHENPWTCKITTRIMWCICKLYLGIVVVVLQYNTLVLHVLELDCIAKLFNDKTNKLQNRKQGHKGSKLDVIGTLGQMQC
jgi:hypothetical protein